MLFALIIGIAVLYLEGRKRPVRRPRLSRALSIVYRVALFVTWIGIIGILVSLAGLYLMIYLLNTGKVTDDINICGLLALTCMVSIILGMTGAITGVLIRSYFKPFAPEPDDSELSFAQRIDQVFQRFTRWLE